VYRQQDLKDKKKWLTPGGFATITQNIKEKHSDSHYVQADPSEPPGCHKFRADDKETFLYGPFKVT